jgi:hypothetical protein
MNIYLAGPMRGQPFFNFPMFHAAAARLRAEGNIVFSPAEQDEETYGKDVGMSNPTGDENEAILVFGVDLDAALHKDMSYICRHADAVALLPGWENSFGAKAEHALALALGRVIILLSRRYIEGK